MIFVFFCSLSHAIVHKFFNTFIHYRHTLRRHFEKCYSHWADSDYHRDYKRIEWAFWDKFSQTRGTNSSLLMGAKSRRKSQKTLFFHHLAACQVLNPGFINSLGCFTFISGKRLKSNRILVQKMTKIST